MNWEKFWNNIAINSNDELDQVLRNDFKSIQVTVNNITENLKIESSDTVLDVCCGNGLITNEISKKCKSITGVDISENLLNLAKTKYQHIDFVKSSATGLTKHFEQNAFDKIYLQFSFQYFDKSGQGESVISEMLKILKPNGKIFIGDIPDYQKKWSYYNSISKRFFYLTSKFKGTNRMGKFWLNKELDSICISQKVNGMSLVQNNELPYSHYRFDYLIIK